MLRLLKGLEDKKEKYESVPFWSWNDKLDPDTLREQIGWMQENGIGGFFMHARGGLRTEYLSEDWMKCVDACIDEAQKRGMQAWVYDENGWPSGFAGGKLLEKEENRDAHITCRIGEYDPDAWLSYLMDGESLSRVTKSTAGECLNLYLNISPSSVDILDSRVVDQFIAETHEKYAARYGSELPGKLFGFFTDEPQYYRWGVAYTRVMPEAYREKYGEDLFDGLGLLFVEKKGYRTFRYRYWYMMQHLMLESFGKKIYEWCEAHGVSFTGHYVEECSLDGQMSCCSGVMPFYKYMHMPGIDWLNRFIGNKLATRQIASVAAQYGKKQVISESFGCCGWDVTPAELKKIADYQYVGGINRTCQHLVPYSEHGQRKRDYPSHFSGLNPWINDYFKEFNDYFTRLGYLLSNNEEEVRIAMLHPIRSAYFDYKDIKSMEGCGLKKLEKSFHDLLERFADDQIPFHFLDETLLEEDGFVNGSRIGCGAREYEYLVIPSCYTMGARTEELIRRYVSNGGKVLLAGEKPAYLEGEPFGYDYLESTVTYEQLKGTLPYRLAEGVSGVHSTLRRSQEGYFLFVQNYGSGEKTVSYSLPEGYRSFESWDLTDMTCRVIPTTFSLKEGESRLLLFSGREPEDVPEKTFIELSGSASVTDCSENYLLLDTVSVSKDGKSFSRELPFAGVFQELLQERYDGDIYLRSRFYIKDLPSRMEAVTEDPAPAVITVNGSERILNGSWDREREFSRGDITDLLKEGENEIVRKIHFHQSEAVYYALYGEGVTETLKNCLSYDTEIEPVYLAGDFGVSMKECVKGQKDGVLLGSGFCVVKRPDEVSELVTGGYPFFAGRMRLHREVDLEDTEAVLRFAGRFQAAKVFVNGSEAGDLIFDNELDISGYTRKGRNDIDLVLTVSNRNLFGPHHMLRDEEPVSVGPYSFDLPDTWTDGMSPDYRESYSFVQVPIK